MNANIALQQTKFSMANLQTPSNSFELCLFLQFFSNFVPMETEINILQFSYLMA